ncbi:P-loop containing nucleoside triphosphate hydrolase protein [Gautieria morchelliformis]|nr:P-loop containing nucleoside triphosphate hydrolase protein [Gautieria morchelliformis]
MAKDDSTSNRGSRLFWRKDKHAPHDADDEKHSTTTDESVVLPMPEQQKPLGASSFTELFRYATKFELFLDFIGLCAAAAAGAAQPLMSLLFGNLTQAFTDFGKILAQTNPPADPATIKAAANHFKSVAALDASYLTYIGLGMLVLTYTYMYIWVYTGEIMAKRLREQYLRAILRQDIAFFDNVGAGEVATRIQTDTHLVQQGTSEKVALVVYFMGSFFCGFILAYAKSWRLALAMSSILPCIGIAGGVMNKFVSSYMQLSRTAVAEGGTLAEEVISTVRTAQAFGTQDKLKALYDDHVRKALVVDAKAAMFHGCGLGVFFFVIYASYALSFSFGATLILRNEANAGEVVNVFLAILIGSFSIALLAPEMQAISHARGAAAKLFVTIDRVPPIDSASDVGLKPSEVVGRIEFDHVKFNYPSRPSVPIVKDLSITFEAGKTAALVGASGSGKSTIVSLVERFYDPLSGVVRLDGQDLRDLNVKWLRGQIGLVSQEPTLFATTIEGNVAHGLIGSKWEHASQEEKSRLIKEACVKSNADGFVSKLPNGYQTMVGERGFLLSGGQKQRIAIARAIVSDPRILLLDEATSALDTQSEGVVQNALDKAAAGRTTITIAHRLSTIKDADQIFVMGEGVVVERGTHSQLLQSDGAYARLVQAQKLREGNEREAGRDDDTLEGSDANEEQDAIEKEAQEEVPLGRRETGSRSLASEILEKRKVEERHKEKIYSLPYLFMRMGRINRETWNWYSIGTCFAIMTGMVYPAFGIVYGGAIQTFQLSGHDLRVQMDRNALWFFLISIISALSIAFQNYLFATSAAQLTFKLRSLSFQAILRQDIAFFDEDQNSTGSLTSSLSDNPQKVNGLAGITLGAIVQSITCIIGGSIIGLAYGWKVALIGIACMPFVVSAGYIRLRIVVLKDQTNKKSHESSAQIACEAAAAIRTVASLTREDDCWELYSESLLAPLLQSNRTAVFSNLLYSISQAMTFFVISLIFWFGSRQVANLELSTKQFFICLMSTVFGSIQAGNVFSFVPDMSSAQGAANDIIHLLDSTPEIDAWSEEGKTPENAQGHIRLEDVHFRYPTRPGIRVLRGMNLEVKPGTYIALVGASGCGKSTVIQLVERFYDPLAGRIYLDGELITDLNIQEYRKQISLVSQEPTLYAGTVRFNILLGAIKPVDEVSQKEIEAACRDANILEFIQSLPNGFDTEVGGKGSQLSGGQKQRIAIARALLRNPKVLLLDEATSALDSNSEKIVQAALDQAAKGRTTIAIAHRLSTIQNADCIYFIKDGGVSEAGTHDQLLALRGGYYEFVQLQALSKK